MLHDLRKIKLFVSLLIDCKQSVFHLSYYRSHHLFMVKSKFNIDFANQVKSISCVSRTLTSLITNSHIANKYESNFKCPSSSYPIARSLATITGGIETSIEKPSM